MALPATDELPYPASRTVRVTEHFPASLRPFLSTANAATCSSQVAAFVRLRRSSVPPGPSDAIGQVGHDAVTRLWFPMTKRQNGCRESRWPWSPPREVGPLCGIRRDQPKIAARTAGSSEAEVLTNVVHPIEWRAEVQNLYFPEFDAHLCYHDLAGEEPVCVYLHGLGTASSADFPHIARDPQLTRYRALLIDLLGLRLQRSTGGVLSHPCRACGDHRATARSARAEPVSSDWPQHGWLHRCRPGRGAS